MHENVLFLDIDTQVDFIDPDGALPAPGARSICPNLKRLTDCARDMEVSIVSTMDTHAVDDKEFDEFGPHCVKDSPGAEKVKETLLSDPFRMAIDAAPPVDPLAALAQGQVIVQKDTLWPLQSEKVLELVQALPDALVVVYGVATDYCVANAVMDLLKHARFPVIVQDAIMPIDADAAADLLADMTGRGAVLRTTDEVIDAVRRDAPQDLIQ